jgi:hypothetical protein
MSLRDPAHQSAIELGEMDTEYISALKQERKVLLAEVERINARLDRIEEILHD